MTMTRVEMIGRPTLIKRKGTLLDTATEVPQFTWSDGVALYDSYNCLKFGARAEFCAPTTKDLDQQAGWIDGFRFAAYGGVTCKAIGLDQDEMKAEVERVFTINETQAVERALMGIRFQESDGTGDFPGQWDAPVDITPGSGAVAPAKGIALLEEYGGAMYAGAPTLHVPVSVASLILGVNGAEFEGEVLRTKFGSKMAAGVGYSVPSTGPDGTNAPAGERWLYVTGEVQYARSDKITVVSMETTTNDVVALAERGYIVSVDCFAAAIRVTI